MSSHAMHSRNPNLPPASRRVRFKTVWKIHRKEHKTSLEVNAGPIKVDRANAESDEIHRVPNHVEWQLRRPSIRRSVKVR
jgi:hypothetical protein